jgi:hypothetical protein
MEKISENIHYELIPANAENEQSWYIRLAEGPFPETVIRYGNIAFNDDDGCLNFSFEVISSPDATVSEDDIALQNYAGDVLESILEKAIADNTLVANERTTDTP